MFMDTHLFTFTANRLVAALPRCVRLRFKTTLIAAETISETRILDAKSSYSNSFGGPAHEL